jgi:hypothetical protein
VRVPTGEDRSEEQFRDANRARYEYSRFNYAVINVPACSASAVPAVLTGRGSVDGDSRPRWARYSCGWEGVG